MIRDIIQINEKLIFIRVVPADEILGKIERGEPVKYDNVIVEGDLDLTKLKLDKDEYDKIVVNSTIKIKNSEIRGFVNSSQVSFRQIIDFMGTVFKKKIWFRSAAFKKEILCIKSVFCEDVDFKDCWCSSANFQNIKFKQNAHFDGAEFLDSVSFAMSIFVKYGNFKKTEFGGGASFWRANFYRDVSFEGSHFKGEALFENAKFGINLIENKNFIWNRIKRDANSDLESLINKINFRNTRFHGQTDFQNAEFYIFTDFTKAWIEGEAIYINARFYKEVYFRFSKFYEIVYFSDAVFKRNASFLGSQFRGELAIFRGALFRGEAGFGGTQFLRFAYFQDVLFKGNVNFKSANFDLDADFQNTKFYKNLDLMGAKINRMSLVNAQYGIDTDILLKFSSFNMLEIDWVEAKIHIKYKYDSEYDLATYSALVKNFQDLVRLEEADSCYYEYKTRFWTSKNRYKYFDPFLIFLGYGIRLRWPLFWISLFIIGYAITYLIPGKPEDWNSERAIIEGILGWLLMPLFIVVLARKLIR